MKTLGWVLLALFSATPSLLPILGDSAAAWIPAGASIYGLTLMPWLALAGLPLPGQREGHVRWGWAQTIFPLAVALPPLGLAFGLDLAQGRHGFELGNGLLYLIGGPLLILFWRLSAVAGLGSLSASRLHVCLWGLMLPLASLAVCALEWAPPTSVVGGAQSALWLSVLNPLMWCLDFTGYDAQFGSLGGELGRLAILLACAAMSWGAVRALGRDAGRALGRRSVL